MSCVLNDAFLSSLDSVDRSFFAIMADLSDRYTQACSPEKNDAVRLAYHAYFKVARTDRLFQHYQNLVDCLLQQSKDYRKNELKNVKPTCGVPYLEHNSLLDARNSSTLNGASGSNVLNRYATDAGWRGFQKAAEYFSKAALCTDSTEERRLFNEGQAALPLVSKKYRPAHVYRLVRVLLDQKDSCLQSDLFNVDKKLLSAFKQRLPLSIAAVAVCQCQKVERNKQNYDVLTKIAADLPGFFRRVGVDYKDLDSVFYFGPARFLKIAASLGY